MGWAGWRCPVLAPGGRRSRGAAPPQAWQTRRMPQGLPLAAEVASAISAISAGPKRSLAPHPLLARWLRPGCAVCRGGASRLRRGAGRRTGRPTTSSAGSSPHRGRTCCGSLTSPTCRLRRASCSWPSSPMPGPGASSAGPWRTTCAYSSSSTLSTWPSPGGDRWMSCITAIRAANTRRWPSGCDARKQACAPAWGRSATPTTTRSPKRCYRPLGVA